MGKGGIGTYTSHAAKGLAAKGCDVHVFAASYHRNEVEKYGELTIHRIISKDPISFRNAVVTSFAYENNQCPFDIVECPEIHGNAWEIKKVIPDITLVVRFHAPNYLVELLKRQYVPFLSKLRFVLGSIKRGRLDLGYWRAYNKTNDSDFQFVKVANYLTAPSQAMKGWIVENWQLEAERIKVIPNIFLPPRKLLKIPIVEDNKHKRVIFFGRLNVLKGLVNATFAIRKILLKNRDWKFRVIGDDGPGPQTNESMRTWMRKQLEPVSHQVEFFDGLSYEELPDAIAEGEIVILPSLFESFSYACLEAMAAGKAIIGSKIGGMSDLLENGKLGLLVDPYRYSELFEKLSLLIHNPQTRLEFAVKARDKILDEYYSEKMCRRVIDFYNEIKR